MTDLDLTLLTDQERKLYEKAIFDTDPHSPPRWFINDFTAALIAARAENQRKDEMLRSLEWSGSYWDSVSGEVLSVCPECDAPHSDMGHLVDCKLDTLLQSEKGGGALDEVRRTLTGNEHRREVEGDWSKFQKGGE